MLGIWLESRWNLVRIQVEYGWNPGGIWLESRWNLIGLGSAWIWVNLVGMVGIWSESRSNLGGFSLTWYSYQIPTIPTIPPGIHSDSTRIQAEYVGEGKVLRFSLHYFACGYLYIVKRLLLLCQHFALHHTSSRSSRHTCGHITVTSSFALVGTLVYKINAA